MILSGIAYLAYYLGRYDSAWYSSTEEDVCTFLLEESRGKTMLSFADHSDCRADLV